MALADLALLAVLIYAIGMASGMGLMDYYHRNVALDSLRRSNRMEFDP